MLTAIEGPRAWTSAGGGDADSWLALSCRRFLPFRGVLLGGCVCH
jgi:hypothetical protein